MERASGGQEVVSVPSALVASAGDLRAGAGEIGFVDATGGLCDSVIIILMIYIRRFSWSVVRFWPDRVAQPHQNTRKRVELEPYPLHV